MMAHATKRRITVSAILGLLSLPISTWGANTLDSRYVHTDQYRLEILRDSTWKAQQRAKLEYVACRQDFTRLECLRGPTK